MELRSDSGSTLIELLISITIVAVILVIIMGAFRIGIRAWETGERDIESFQRQQIVFSIMKRQMASISWRPIPVKDAEPFVFNGEEQLIDFVSTVSVVPGSDFGSVRVTYRVGRDNKNDSCYLEIAERNFITGKAGDTIDGLDDEMIHELIGNVYDIRFEYMKPPLPEEEAQWQPLWNTDTDAGLPAAVKCILQMDEKKSPVTVVARVLSQAEGS